MERAALFSPCLPLAPLGNVLGLMVREEPAPIVLIKPEAALSTRLCDAVDDSRSYNISIKNHLSSKLGGGLVGRCLEAEEEAGCPEFLRCHEYAFSETFVSIGIPADREL